MTTAYDLLRTHCSEDFVNRLCKLPYLTVRVDEDHPYEFLIMFCVKNRMEFDFYHLTVDEVGITWQTPHVRFSTTVVGTSITPKEGDVLNELEEHHHLKDLFPGDEIPLPEILMGIQLEPHPPVM